MAEPFARYEATWPDGRHFYVLGLRFDCGTELRARHPEGYDQAEAHLLALVTQHGSPAAAHAVLTAAP